MRFVKNKNRRLFGPPRTKTNLRLLGLLVLFLLLSWILIKTVSEKTGGENVFVKHPSAEKLEETPISDSLIATVKEESESVGYFSDFYNRVTSFPDFAGYVKSKEKTGKIQFLTSDNELAGKLNSIRQGRTVNFLAPVRLYSQTGTEDVFIPFLSLQKKGGKVSVASVGEYWNIVQRNLNDLRKNGGIGETTELEKLLGNTGGNTSEKRPYAVLNDKGGDVFSFSSGITTLEQIFNGTGEALRDEIDAYENDGDRTKESLISDQLSSLLFAASNDQNYQEKIAGIIKSVAGSAGTLFLETEDEANYYSTAEARCKNSGGKWFFEECNCPAGLDIRIDGSCSPKEKLKNSCEKSGGAWEETDRSSVLLNVCGKEKTSSDSGNGDSQSSTEEIPINKLALGNSYCNCPVDSCLGPDGICNKNDGDNDGDGIINRQDNCPTTDAFDTDAMNQEAGSDYFGCNCDQIGTVMKNCPESKCLGSHWTVYSKGQQECKDGRLLPYACDFEKEGLSKFCANPLRTGQLSISTKGSGVDADRGVGQEAGKDNHDGQSQARDFPVSNLDINDNESGSSGDQTGSDELPAIQTPSSSSGSGNGTNNGDKSRLGIIPGPALKNDYFARDNTDWSKILPTVKSTSGQNGLGANSNGSGKAEGLKAALRRIYNQDYQTYKMIFTYLDTIKHKDGGGVCEGCGKAKVDYNAPYKVLDQIIVHEAAHCAQDCVGGIGGFTRRELERIAVEKQIGSAHFENPIATSKGTIYDLMEEFPSQRSQFVSYKGFEVRGYLARYWCSASPQGLNCGKGGEGFDLGDKSVFLDWLFNRANFLNWPIRPVYAYEPRASKSGEYYYYGVGDGDANWGITYATVSKAVPEPPDNTYGGYPYGFGKAVLGAKQKEEDVIRKFMAMSNQDLYPCKSDPAKIGLPPAFGCEGAPAPKLEDGGNIGD